MELVEKKVWTINDLSDPVFRVCFVNGDVEFIVARERISKRIGSITVEYLSKRKVFRFMYDLRRPDIDAIFRAVGKMKSCRTIINLVDFVDHRERWELCWNSQGIDWSPMRKLASVNSLITNFYRFCHDGDDVCDYVAAVKESDPDYTGEGIDVYDGDEFYARLLIKYPDLKVTGDCQLRYVYSHLNSHWFNMSLCKTLHFIRSTDALERESIFGAVKVVLIDEDLENYESLKSLPSVTAVTVGTRRNRVGHVKLDKLLCFIGQNLKVIRIVCNNWNNANTPHLKAIIEQRPVRQIEIDAPEGSDQSPLPLLKAIVESSNHKIKTFKIPYFSFDSESIRISEPGWKAFPVVKRLLERFTGAKTLDVKINFKQETSRIREICQEVVTQNHRRHIVFRIHETHFGRIVWRENF